MKRIKKVIKIIENEKECVKQANTCDRNCAICPLVKEDKEIIAAYDYVLEVLHNIRKDEYIRKDKLIHASAVRPSHRDSEARPRAPCGFHHR